MDTNSKKRFDDEKIGFNLTISHLGHFIYFSSLFILNNPFVFMESEYRFGLFISCLVIGAYLIFFSEDKKSTINNVPILTLLFLYAMSSIRINSASSFDEYGKNVEITQSIVTIISISTSWLISNRFDIRKMNLSLIMISGVCFFPIFLNSDSLFDYFTKSSYTLGVLNYDSYQAASQIIGFFAISLTAYTISNKRNILYYFITFAIVCLALYTITLSPARGEAIALVIALSILFISGNNFNFIFLILIGLFFSSQSFLESTLGSRLTEITSGDFGERDYLFSLSISQFFGNLKTFLVGDGLNGFQYYNSLPVELYPHNFLLEGAVSGGIMFLCFLIYIFVAPIFRLILRRKRTADENLALSIMIFLALINMKSGSLVSFWGLGAYTALFLRASSKRSVDRVAEQISGRFTRMQMST